MTDMLNVVERAGDNLLPAEDYIAREQRGRGRGRPHRSAAGRRRVAAYVDGYRPGYAASRSAMRSKKPDHPCPRPRPAPAASGRVARIASRCDRLRGRRRRPCTRAPPASGSSVIVNTSRSGATTSRYILPSGSRPLREHDQPPRTLRPHVHRNRGQRDLRLGAAEPVREPLRLGPLLHTCSRGASNTRVISMVRLVLSHRRDPPPRSRASSRSKLDSQWGR